MRTIQFDLQTKNISDIPSQFRGMKRLWAGRGLGGLIERREKEAALFENGLSCSHYGK